MGTTALTARQAVRMWLARHDKTQRWLAAQLGVSEGFFSLVLSGHRNATDEFRDALFAMTGVDLRKHVAQAVA